MRIALAVHRFPPESLGGVEVYTWDLARALTRAGHEVGVFYPLAGVTPEAQRVERDGVRLWRALQDIDRAQEGPVSQFWHTFRDTGIEAEFVRFLAETRPEVVHFQHVQGVSARLIEMARGRPRLLTLHDFWFFCFNSQLLRPGDELCGGPRLGWNCVDCATVRPDLRGLRAVRPLVALPLAYRNAALRRTVEGVDLFIAPSEFLRRRYIGEGFPGQHIRVLENGLDVERLAAEPPSPLPSPPGRPHFGFIGALAPHKGVHVLIDAFNRLPPGAALTIYGNEDALPAYVAELKALARHPHVRLAGQLDPRAVGAALRQMDCLVVPSLWYENSPVVIQEAFACGRPVIASRVGALEEKVQDGVTGYLFPAADAEALARIMQAMMDDPARLASLAANVRPGPTIGEHAEALLEIYRSLLD
jgi:glycosyltransferase involved in cell wall biosynthesis